MKRNQIHSGIPPPSFVGTFISVMERQKYFRSANATNIKNDKIKEEGFYRSSKEEDSKISVDRKGPPDQNSNPEDREHCTALESFTRANNLRPKVVAVFEFDDLGCDVSHSPIKAPPEKKWEPHHSLQLPHGDSPDERQKRKDACKFLASKAEKAHPHP